MDRFRLRSRTHLKLALTEALTVDRIDFESVGGGGSVRGPSDAEGVIANVVSAQVRHIQVH